MNTNRHPQIDAGLRNALRLCVFVMFLATSGCNRNAGPARYNLTGTITYGGKPIPAGYILFAPDTSKGNDGPGADAEIKDGVYRMRPNEGTVGGPHIATISGFDGVSFQRGLTLNPMGLPIFSSVQVSVDLPKAAATHDFAIPAKTK